MRRGWRRLCITKSLGKKSVEDVYDVRCGGIARDEVKLSASSAQGGHPVPNGSKPEKQGLAFKLFGISSTAFKIFRFGATKSLMLSQPRIETLWKQIRVNT